MTYLSNILKIKNQRCRLCENCLKIGLLLQKYFHHIIRKLDHSITFTTYIELLYEREVTHEFRAEGRSENPGGGNSNVVDIFCPTDEIELIDLSKKGGGKISASLSSLYS